ncbi:hypothetical protein C8Q80DRAFT_1125240 [Daedaleopsis nitida]|nr:hypothetical protein C8Q80DRAFT_1125240 [Daedaleopsis nitida]
MPLLQLLPSLRTLQLMKSRLPAAAAYPGAHIRHLIVAEASDSAPVQGSMTVDRLTFFANPVSKRPPQTFSDFCIASRLVSLTVRYPGTFVLWSGSIWDEIFPNFRLLEIEHCATLDEFVTTFAGAVSQAQESAPSHTLLCLTLLGSLPASAAARDMSECHRKFLERVTTRIHSLRYIGLAEVGARFISDWQDDFSGTRALWRWWKVVHSGVEDTVPVEVREISAWEGERVRSFLRNADITTVESFDLFWQGISCP